MIWSSPLQLVTLFGKYHFTGSALQQAVQRVQFVDLVLPKSTHNFPELTRVIMVFDR